MDSSVAPELVDPFLGREIAGKYRVLARLGAGGMGAVYRARHLGTTGDVAIKFLHGTAVGDDHAVRRFHLEAQNVAALRHANTVRVIDFGVDQGTLYLVMEHLVGHPLSDVLAREGPLPWRRVVHITRQILKSLWEAHEHPKRIIHRDIKPANVFLVDLAGEPDHVRVLDFGVSRALDSSGAGTQGLIGTPFYMAPELWRGEGVDARTDLYALGCVAYQALAGNPPFVPPPSATDSLYPLLNMHLHDPPPPLAQVRPNVPAPIAAWVDRLLAKEPNRRPASARIALEALDEAVAACEHGASPPSAPTPAAPPRTSTPTATDARERGLPAWIVIVAGVVLLGAIAAVVIAVSRQEPPPMPALLATPQPSARDTAPRVHPLFGNLVFSYRARLSAADHLDEDGDPLDDAAAVITLDRRRYHAGVGDPEDGFDTVFKDDNMQAQLYQLVDGYIDEPTRRAVLEGRPLVEIAIHERGLVVSVVPE